MEILGKQVLVEQLRDRIYFLTDTSGVFYSDVKLRFIKDGDVFVTENDKIESIELEAAYLTSHNYIYNESIAWAKDDHTTSFTKEQYNADPDLRREVAYSTVWANREIHEFELSDEQLIKETAMELIGMGLTPDKEVIEEELAKVDKFRAEELNVTPETVAEKDKNIKEFLEELKQKHPDSK